MKKFISVIAAFALALSVSGCGQEESSISPEHSDDIESTLNNTNVSLNDTNIPLYDENNLTLGNFYINFWEEHTNGGSQTLFWVGKDSWYGMLFENNILNLHTVDRTFEFDITSNNENNLKYNFTGAGHAICEDNTFYIGLSKDGTAIPAEAILSGSADYSDAEITVITSVLNEDSVSNMIPETPKEGSAVWYTIEFSDYCMDIYAGMEYRNLIEAIGQGIKTQNGKDTYYVYKTDGYSLIIGHDTYDIGGTNYDLINTITLMANEAETHEETTHIGEPDTQDTTAINENILTIENNVLIKCSTAATGEIMIPDGVTSIHTGAFEKCSDINSVIIPEGVTSIGDNAFSKCTDLINITIPDSVTYIGKWAFSGCTSLENINIPNGVTAIEDYAFQECKSLTSIIIPDGVTRIGSNAFWSCTNLSSIVIPDSTTFIYIDAFEWCQNLTDITYKGHTFSDRDEIYRLMNE